MGLDHPLTEQEIAAIHKEQLKRTIQVQFQDWLVSNPDFWPLFVRFAKQLLSSGRRRYGVAAIVERVRWHMYVETKGEDPFKINNNFRSRLARKLAEEHPEFEGFFQTRRLQRD